MENPGTKKVLKRQIVTGPYFDSYVCLDIETTSRPMNRIIEVVAVKSSKGRIVKEFRRLVDPGIPIPREIVKLTGITDSMVKGRRSIWQILPELKKFLGDSILVGHDIITNDLKNLISCGDICGVEFDNEVFDTLKFAKSFIPGTCGLSNLTDLLGVPWTERHRALSDARANMEVFEKLKIIYSMIKNEGITLTPGEISRIAQNPEGYMGVTDKFMF